MIATRTGVLQRLEHGLLTRHGPDLLQHQFPFIAQLAPLEGCLPAESIHHLTPIPRIHLTQKFAKMRKTFHSIRLT